MTIEVFHENGELKAKQIFENGLPIKTWKTYDSNGKLVKETPHERGAIHGYIKYYSQGKMVKMSRYVYGTQQGIETSFIPLGKGKLKHPISATRSPDYSMNILRQAKLKSKDHSNSTSKMESGFSSISRETLLKKNASRMVV